MKDNVAKPEFGKIAAALARRGFHVFPLGVNSKEPAIKGFPTRATADQAQIDTWAKNGPHRNVGVSTTASAHGPLLAVDVDDKDGRTGSESIVRLEMEGFDLPPTFTVKTPSGGRHYYFTVPAAMKQGVDVLGSGVDTRSKGGYVAGPGSIVNGGVYEIVNDLPVAAAPQWLLDRLQRAPEGEAKAGERLDGINAARARRRAIEWLQLYAPAGTAGNRNDTAFVVAAKLKDFGCEPEEVLELMESHWECDPPAPAEDLEKIIRNAFKYAREAQGSADPGAAFAGAAAAGAGAGSGGGDSSGGGDAGDAGGDDQAKEKAQGEARRRQYFFDGETPPAPPKQLIKRLLNSTGVAIVGGQSGAGKTFVVVDMAVALASGQGFFDHKVKERVGVVILAYEGAGSIHRRIKAAREGRGIEGVLPIVWSRGVSDLRSREAIADLIEDMKAVDAKMQERFGVRLGVIIIDTLGRAFSMNDENDNAEANAIIGSLDRLSVDTGAAVVAVHHYGKTEAVGLRGASAWRGGADTVLSVLADRNETTGAVSNRRLALAKSREDEEGPLSGFELVEVRVGVDEDLETITTCRVEPREARRASCDTDVPPEKAQECLDALRGKDHRYDKQAPAWAGRVIARVLAIDLGIDGAKRAVEKIIDRWIAKGVLESFTAPDANRKDKIYVRVVGGFEA
jgi:AAA domain/Bifunctional DNA primase/polymerase, N-terminal